MATDDELPKRKPRDPERSNGHPVRVKPLRTKGEGEEKKIRGKVPPKDEPASKAKDVDGDFNTSVQHRKFLRRWTKLEEQYPEAVVAFKVLAVYGRDNVGWRSFGRLVTTGKADR